MAIITEILKTHTIYLEPCFWKALKNVQQFSLVFLSEAIVYSLLSAPLLWSCITTPYTYITFYNPAQRSLESTVLQIIQSKNGHFFLVF